MDKDLHIEQRSRVFRDEYVAATPRWYRGELHLAFTLIFTGGVLAYCIWRLDHPTLAEWLAIVPMLLFGNWAEWAAHRYLLHRPTRWFKAVYKRHVGVHHLFFAHNTLEYRGHKHWRALLFPPFAPVLFVGTALLPALLLGHFWSRNVGYIVVLTMAGYYLMYEGLHTLSHVVDSPLLDALPLVNTVRRMHVIHHHPELMGTRNFNLTFPICDALFGTSDLDKGLFGTLFNGMSHAAMRSEDRRRMFGEDSSTQGARAGKPGTDAAASR